jgi:hypothetical protein
VNGCESTSRSTSCTGRSTGTAITSGRGTITSTASLSANSKTLWSISCSSSSSTPFSRLAVTSIFSSSSEWTSVTPLDALTPNQRSTAALERTSTQMNGRKIT